MINVLLTEPSHCLSLSLMAITEQRHDINLIFLPDHDWQLWLQQQTKIDAVIITPQYQIADWTVGQRMQYLQGLANWIDYCQRYTTLLVWCYGDEIYGIGDSEKIINESTIINAEQDWIHEWLEQETFIRNNLVHFIILRLAPLIALKGDGAQMANYFSALYRQQNLFASSEIIVGPVSVNAVAFALVGILLQINNGAAGSGVYQLAGVEPVTWLAFMQALREIFLEQLQQQDLLSRQLGEIVAEVPKQQLIRRVLDCRHILNTFGVQQKPWRLALADMAKQWIENELFQPLPPI